MTSTVSGSYSTVTPLVAHCWYDLGPIVPFTNPSTLLGTSLVAVTVPSSTWLHIPLGALQQWTACLADIVPLLLLWSRSLCG